jgi:hypothetical protein
LTETSKKDSFQYLLLAYLLSYSFSPKLALFLYIRIDDCQALFDFLDTVFIVIGAFFAFGLDIIPAVAYMSIINCNWPLGSLKQYDFGSMKEW